MTGASLPSGTTPAPRCVKEQCCYQGECGREGACVYSPEVVDKYAARARPAAPLGGEPQRCNWRQPGDGGRCLLIAGHSGGVHERPGGASETAPLVSHAEIMVAIEKAVLSCSAQWKLHPSLWVVDYAAILKSALAGRPADAPGGERPWLDGNQRLLVMVPTDEHLDALKAVARAEHDKPENAAASVMRAVCACGHPNIGATLPLCALLRELRRAKRNPPAASLSEVKDG